MIQIPREQLHKVPVEGEDSGLFRAAMAGVKPRSAVAHAATRRAVPAPHPRSREADEQAILHELLDGPFDADLADCVETLQYRGPGIQDRVWRRLVRGRYHIEAEIDLHGLNREQAYLAVAQFIMECRDRDQRCVRIIHGKGLRSSGRGPVLRTLLGGWLRRRDDVLAFCQARPEHGGSGASYVLLRAAATLPST
ncbi:MAG: hypothetical protein EPN72_11180 [Nevskiaceae bacterium]|nr:MAG: hypothetical protein EPN63_01800 [Nevskiaceae bacterium]TBR71766.1 MAG: hypothetical protein EPN72_11180 [Nevskiaceae bacterium]